MKNSTHIIFCNALLFLVIFMSAHALASEQQKEKTSSTATQKQDVKVPELAEIIPLSAKLSGRFAELTNNLKQVPDSSVVDQEYVQVATDLKGFTSKLYQLKKSDRYNLAKIYALSQAVANQESLLENVGKPLINEIRLLDGWKTKWLSEKVNWDNWQSSLLKDQPPEHLKLAFKKSTKLINTSLELVTQHLEHMLALQAKGGEIARDISIFDANVRAMISAAHQVGLHNKSPPMLSILYISQYNRELWYAVGDHLSFFSLPDSQYFAQHLLANLLRVFLFVMLLAVIYLNRENLKETEHWKFLAERPISSALFITILLSMLFITYFPILESMLVVYKIIGGISCIRLIEQVIKQGWQRHAIVTVMIIYIITEIFAAIGLPPPLERLYIFLVSLIAIRLLLRWARQSSSVQKEPDLYIWLIRACITFFVAIIIAELLGNAGIATYLFRSALLSMATIVPYILLIHIIYGSLHWVFFASPVWQVKLMRNDAALIVRRVGFLLVVCIVCFALLPAILVAWELYNNVLEATTSIYSYTFNIGTVHVSLSKIVASVGIFYCTLLVSLILPKIILDEGVSGRPMARGVQQSIAKLMRYVIVLIGIILIFSTLGFDFTNITIILSAFSIGIGFGLQGIVNNFVSGLILLFERPLTEGDTVDISGSMVHINKIGLRSTIVRTFDGADWIIPNADLINNKVTNWTLTNRVVRIRIPVGVAYGSDVSLVEETLMACVKEQEDIVKSPAPQVRFMNLGDSSLDFELRVWIQDVDDGLRVKSELYHKIEQKFQELNIVIPFPQRDLHVHGLDNSVGLSTRATAVRQEEKSEVRSSKVSDAETRETEPKQSDDF